MGNIDNVPRADQSVESIFREIASVTLSDDDDLEKMCDAFYLPVGGTVKVTTAHGSDIAVPFLAGYHHIAVTRFWSTGTTGSLAVYACYR